MAQQRAQSSQPTIMERLKDIATLNSNVRAQGLYSYAEARAGYVGYDRMAGSSSARLAAAFKDFDPAIRYAHEKYLDRKIAEDASEAALFGKEHPELVENMEAWEKLGKNHPEVQNKSPWVRQYIRNLAYQNQALQIDTALNDYYVTSGLVNEKDSSKVAEKANKFVTQAIEQSGLKENPDDWIALGRNFLSPLRNSVAGLMARHTRDVESQNTNLLFEQYSQKFDNLIFGQTNILNGGKNINIPRDRAAANAFTAQTLQESCKKLSSLGMRDDQLMNFCHAQLLSGKFTASQVEAISKAVTFERNGEQVSLASQPGFAKALSKLKDEEMDRSWKSEVRGRQRMAWVREDFARNAANWAVADAFDGKNLKESLMERGLDKADASTIQAYREAYNLASSVQFTSAYSTPKRTAETLDLQYDLLTGTAGPAEVITRAKAGDMTAAEAQSFIGIAAKNSSDEGRMLSAATQDVAEIAMSDALNITRSEASDLLQQGVKDLPEHISRAREEAKNAGLAFATAWEEEKKTSGKKGTALEITRFKQEFIAKSSTTRGNKVVEERATKRSGDLTRTVITGIGEKISPRSTLFEADGVSVQLPVSSLNERNQKITYAYQNALSTLNTLFPDWKTKDPEDLEALAKLRKDVSGLYQIDDLADMLMLGQGLYGKAFTVDKAASIVVGKVIPADAMTRVQLKNVMEARIKELNKLTQK